VWEVLDFYRDVFGSEETATMLQPYPLLAAHFARVEAAEGGRLAAHREARNYLPWADYKREVRNTLAD
jgi:hypothetical protein